MPGVESFTVTINAREVVYTSDYPEGWKFLAGDPFKLTIIDGTPCFIKRFEQERPDDISGWDLLVKMTGKYEKNLSRVYDIKIVQEDGREVCYVFYEWLDGITLEASVRAGAGIDLTQLNNDLFDAIRALQKYEFWFADFTEKNIFCEKSGTFVLVDVDSSQRLSALPDNEMHGSKDYWILVLKFYKEFLNKKDLRLSDINGISLNYLQVPFLVLRLKLLLTSNVKDYNSTPFFNQLPSRLNQMVPEMKDIYLQVIKNGRTPISNEEISRIEHIIETKIIETAQVPNIAVTPVILPVIKTFTTDTNEVESGGAFTLSWQVENTSKLELYKNGAKFKTLDIAQSEVSLKEFADGTRQQSLYQLIAFRDLDMAKSDSITIKFKTTRPKKNKLLKVVGIVSAVIAFIVLSYFLYPVIMPGAGKMYIKQTVLRKGIDSLITIYGENFPSANKIIVLMNDTKSTILSGSADSLLVLLPATKFTTTNDSAYVFVNFNSETTNAGNFVYLPPVGLKQRDLYEDSTLTIYGKNLNTKSIKVFFENKELPVLAQSDTGLTIQIPPLEDTVSGQQAKLIVSENNSTIFSWNFLVTYDTIDLIRLAPRASWMGGILESDGNSTTNNAILPWPCIGNEPTGFVRSDITFMEDGNKYLVLRTHPMWLSNGTIKGFFPLNKLKGKKTFKAQVGFLQEGKTTDGVVFNILVHYRLNVVEFSRPAKRKFKIYTGELDNFFADFPAGVPGVFFIELRVDAGIQSNVDWAAWVNPIIISRRLKAVAAR